MAMPDPEEASVGPAAPASAVPHPENASASLAAPVDSAHKPLLYKRMPISKKAVVVKK
eukprot:CAMPEP_0172696046 /NCGR_PEP_ID=MMETSP1074-20121228/27773_1 /TAXON_ID=2916 /ORGANISM="Ceratium fusus, Strain PA161109" /LENGTH=57 /DNA_ID=CAMNT_0013516733 /DNA_START=35 /DNA_END=205 /DNA_ORIENTATION=+